MGAAEGVWSTYPRGKHHKEFWQCEQQLRRHGISGLEMRAVQGMLELREFEPEGTGVVPRRQRLARICASLRRQTEARRYRRLRASAAGRSSSTVRTVVTGTLLAKACFAREVMAELWGKANGLLGAGRGGSMQHVCSGVRIHGPTAL